MLKISCIKSFSRIFLNKIVTICRHKSNAEDYEILKHLVDKKIDMTKVLVPEAKYGGEVVVSLITGTEPGRKAADYVKEIFYKLHAPIYFEVINVDMNNIDRRDLVLSVLRNKFALNFDVHHTEIKKTEQLQINDDLNLYAGVVKVFPFYGYKTKIRDVDIVMIIQNSAGDNTKLEYEPVSGLIETLKVTEESEVMKLVSYAFAYAVKNRRKKITVIHKTSNFPVTDSVILECAKYVKKEFPQLRVDEMEVDEAARELVENPQRFDIICVDDRYGTTLTSIACAICGGPNLFSYSNIGDNHAVFQPLQNKLSIPLQTEEFSPYGLITTVVQLLLHMELSDCAEVIWKSLLKTMLFDNMKTSSYCGNYTEKEVIERVICNLEYQRCKKH